MITDPRFPRVKCAMCKVLCVPGETAKEYRLVRVEDGLSRVVWLGDECASKMPQGFRAEPVG